MSTPNDTDNNTFQAAVLQGKNLKKMFLQYLMFIESLMKFQTFIFFILYCLLLINKNLKNLFLALNIFSYVVKFLTVYSLFKIGIIFSCH
jgi:hypothetical protein